MDRWDRQMHTQITDSVCIGLKTQCPVLITNLKRSLLAWSGLTQLLFCQTSCVSASFAHDLE